MKPGESSSFCVVPWLHRHVNEQGFFKVCCVAEGRENFLTDSRGKRLHIQGGESEEELFNNPGLKELRRKMLHGEWDPICRRCLDAEQAGGSSSRTGRNKRFRHRVPDLLSDTAPDGAITAPAIRHLDMRLGNYCNLTCRMCGPGASKPWIEPYNRVQPPAYQTDSDGLTIARNIEWVGDPAVWRKFRDQLPSVEWLHFAGGEPMMIPEMIDALRICVDSGFAGGIDLSYNTNITLLPKDIGELWPRFKSVSLSCSIDGYGSLNEYIRRPSRWRDIDRHLHTLDAHFHDWKLRQVSIHTTVQVYNVLDLDKLYAYLRSGFEHVLPAPVLNPLSSPAYLSIQNLPPDVKILARERLVKEKTREEYRRRKNTAWLLNSIDTVVAYMDGANPTDHWKDFFSFTASSDREFGDSFTCAAPELAALLAESGLWPG
jgi:sulfatase maturation enzyme AslB (radical SAM superfamily)